MIELRADAEKRALAATDIDVFRGLPLLDLKEKVADLLRLIGRVDGAFSTYTQHTIEHAEAMLRMLDWLVPPETEKAMRPADWLLITLASYFHDLGLVVSHEEFRDRDTNAAFVSWKNDLMTNPEFDDYRARMAAMGDAERESFVFQEFVRDGHAERIRDWISGRYHATEGTAVAGAAIEVAKLVAPLPPRFIEHLALVCASHHADDLDNVEKYRLFQRYSTDERAAANVQFAALLLRTTDLLHVTRDRTPSVMYRAIGLTDPKSVKEWDKQRGAFAVGQKLPAFDPNAVESHVVVVTADFAAEEPFFSMSEYLTWADEQLKQTKRWADRSRSSAAARSFWFPWHTIEQDILVEGNLPQTLQFELDRGRLLNLLVGHTLYNDPTVAVRELLQNAIDAVRYQHFRRAGATAGTGAGSAQMGRVLVGWNPVSRVLEVTDNGTGMDRDTIENHLMKVGSSFYDTPQFRARNALFCPISRFGIGILTCFMVSDDVEIITWRDGVGYRMRMTSVTSKYVLKELEPRDPALAGRGPHGTLVRVRIRGSVDLTSRSMEAIVRYWVILPECEVAYAETGKAEVRVGYASVADAASAFFLTKGASRPGLSRRDVATTTTRKMGTDEYALALAVEADQVFDFRTLTGPEEGVRSVVTVEGIRVASTLPGLERRSLAGVLSVRGNRRFRTTVSREGLEEDDEYWRVGQIVLEMVYEYVASEVERIAAKEGHPLSQAAMAARWGYQSVAGSCSAELSSSAASLYGRLPLVVVEQVPSDRQAPPRRLCSLEEIRALDAFWTMEWRVIDYLGTIGKDLGCEIPYGELLRVAGADADLAVSPVLLEAFLYARDLGQTHCPQLVRYSRQHQRALVRWGRRREPALGLSDFTEHRCTRAATGLVQQLLDDVSAGMQFLEMRETLRLRSECVPNFNQIAVGTLDGDVNGVVGVRTRMGVILDSRWAVADAWNHLERAWRLLLQEPHELPEHLIGALCLAVLSFYLAVFPRRDPYTLSRDANQIQVIARNVWRAVAGDAERALEQLGVPGALPLDVTESLAMKDLWFDPSDYWRRWTVEE